MQSEATICGSAALRNSASVLSRLQQQRLTQCQCQQTAERGTGLFRDRLLSSKFFELKHFTICNNICIITAVMQIDGTGDSQCNTTPQTLISRNLIPFYWEL